MTDQTRRDFLKTLGTATLSAGSFSVLSGLGMTGCAKSGKKQRPNVILVLTDDQGYGDLSCHGSPYVKTPVLDGLHGESVRLTNFHVDPCCSPTRASLLTGQYSSRAGVWHTIGGRSLLREDKTTIADVFKASGYRTAVFGKWHLGDNYPFRPQDRGFDDTLVHRNGSVGNRWDHWGNDYYDDTYIRNGVPEKFEGYCNTIWFDEAIKFIETNRENPFFCFLSTNIPHAPLIVDEEYAEPYRSQVSDRLSNYYGMVSKFDEDLGRLLKSVKNLGLEENTIFIFMTDNGPCPWYGGIVIDEDGFVLEGYSAGMRGGKIWGYENAHRVPCFIRWPGGGIGGGRDVNTLTAHFDWFPTLIDWCGLRHPQGIEFDGTSLAPLLSSQERKWSDRTLFVHNQRVDFPIKYKDYQVLTERWRLIKRDGEELYDITTDPGQRNNIADQYPAVVQDLHNKYEEWWTDISKDMDVYPKIIIGSETENPLTLFGHDAHRKSRERIWVIDAEEDGHYRFQLFRWPKESNKPINENREGESVLANDQGHIRIGNIESSAAIASDSAHTEIDVHIMGGPTCLEAWFSNSKTGETTGAEFVLVERIGPPNPADVCAYHPSDPDSLLKERE